MDSQRKSSEEAGRPPKRIRRSHRKSRTGCGNCKKRRIKCDETRPQCQNCGDFGVECDYTSGADGLRDASFERAFFVNSQGPRLRGKRGRPRTRWNAEQLATPPADDGLAPSQINSVSPVPGNACQLVSQNPSRLPEYTDELRLLHYFLTREDESGADHPPTYHAFRLQAPVLGFEYPFVLHLVYEFAALDYVRLQPPERRPHYYSLAAHYSALGLQGVTETLPQLNADNCHAIYMAAIFACINAFARGPQPDEYLLFSERGPPQWLPLMRGIRTLMDMIGIEKIASGPQGDLPVDTSPKAAQPIALMLGRPRVEWIGQFNRLQVFVEAISGLELAVNDKALGELRLCYEATYGGPDGEYQGNADYQNVFIWTYRLEEEFAAFLQRKRPVALIILAHFAVLLKNFEFVWFLKGWSDHIIEGVQRFVGESLRDWLQWPIEQAKAMGKKRNNQDLGQAVEILDDLRLVQIHYDE